VISVEEFGYGLAWKPSPRIREALEEFLDAFCELLTVTEEIARDAGRLRGEFQRRGISNSQADMLIAATANAHKLTLVTRNVGHFEGCGIPLLNPFKFEAGSRPATP